MLRVLKRSHSNILNILSIFNIQTCLAGLNYLIYFYVNAQGFEISTFGIFIISQKFETNKFVRF